MRGDGLPDVPKESQVSNNLFMFYSYFNILYRYVVHYIPLLSISVDEGDKVVLRNCTVSKILSLQDGCSESEKRFVEDFLIELDSEVYLYVQH